MMAPFSPQLNLSPSRYRAFSSNSMSRASNYYRRVVRSPGMLSHASLSPKSTPSPKRKGRSSASASVFTSLMNALKLRPKGKKPAQKLLSPAHSVAAAPESRHAKQGLQRARSVPPVGSRKQIQARRKRTASSGDGMEVDGDKADVGEEVGPTQYLYYDVSENPFATPPCTPGTPLSPMMLDNDAETPASSPASVKSRKRRAVERSRMKTLQLLGPEACMAISEQYGGEEGVGGLRFDELRYDIE